MGPGALGRTRAHALASALFRPLDCARTASCRAYESMFPVV